MGNILSAGLGQAPARQAALGTGLSDKIEFTTINKVRGSGLKAVTLADQAIICADANVVYCMRYGKHVKCPIFAS